MARFNEILVGRFNRALQKVTGIKGAAAVPQLGSEIAGTFPLFWGSEMRYLESWNRFAVADNQGAVAAQNSLLRLRNPVGSNVVGVIEKLMLTNQNAAVSNYQLFLNQPGADLAANDTSFVTRLDARSQALHPVLNISRANNVASPGFVIFQLPTFGVNAIYDFVICETQEITLLPGDGIDISNATVNQQCTASFIWRERFLEDSERF